MCGIFGTIGANCVTNTLLALHQLEYRGYDSAGIGVKTECGLQIEKSTGRVNALKVDFVAGKVAIGHTRWATHGKVCKQNAHPFVSYDGNFAVVHNGIVENYLQHKLGLQRQGVEFASQTDSEVIAHLLAKHFDGDVATTLQKVCNMLTGSFAVVVATRLDDNLYAYKRGSALCVGKGKQGACVCSDVAVMEQFASSVAVLPENCLAVLGNSVDLWVEGKHVEPCYFAPSHTDCDTNQLQGDAMLAEIFQIPDAVRQTYDYYFASGGLCLDKKQVNGYKRVYFVGCGTAYHSAMVGCSLLQRLAQMDCQAVVASEYVYDSFPTDKHTLVVAISQSGETADTLKAVQKAKRQGATVYAVTNVCNSSLCFEASFVKFVKAGREISVASTKAYNCQLVALTLFAVDFAHAKGRLSARARSRYLTCFDKVPSACKHLVSQSTAFALMAKRYKQAHLAYFVGRRLDFATAKEGALKLKEVSYLPSEAYPSGELKHGTLAMMEQGVLVVALACEKDLVDKCCNTVAEVTSRGASALVLSQYPVSPTSNQVQVVSLPVVDEIFAPIVSVVPLQLFAYYFAKGRGCDVDRPRNLAKSVTVE